MQTFNWIEISDLHYGLRDQGPLWPNVREVFFDDLTKLSEKTGPWNAVIFTGDLTQQGAQEEFASLDSEVFEPLWRTLERLGSKQVTLITVPGNHDLVRPDTRKPSAAVRQLLRQNSFYEIEDEFWSDGTCEYRAVVDKAFANYVSWIENSSFCSTQSMQRGILPGDFSLTLTLTENGGTVPLEIGIVGINTAFLQLAGGDYKGRLVWDIKQIHGACGNDLPKWVGRHMACVLLTHHGPDWLDTRSRDVVYPEINPAGRFAVHMFGHMHENIERATSLGGGPPLRQWQAASLFGMEQFGEPPTLDRRHGYSVGRLAYSEGELTIRHWPRVAVRDANGWRFERDAKNTVLDETDGGTTWEKVLSRATKHHRSTASLCERQEKSTVLGRKRAQTSNFGWPHDQPQLRAYCEGVSKAHSHIRFVEIPYLKDLSDIELDSLYVEPRLSSNEIHPDMLLHKWPRTLQPIEALRQHPRLVLLGDPGSGKSTLISCLSWQLCRPRPLTPNAWAQEFGGFLPLPMILRELRLKSDLTWEGLLDAFLQHRIGMLLVNRENIEKLLAEGRAMVLLDGLDEIGNISIRKKLRDAVHIGMANYPSSRWLLTSRVVGYEQVPFHTKIEIISGLSKTTAEMLGATNRKKRIRTPMADILFLAPFNDEQIRSFATNWYAQHEKDKQIVDVQAEEFVTAIRENEGTQRLGRIPYLLTLMALIHHKNSRLPHGRTELYERIAAAYLESIDLRRRLDQLPYSLAQKKRWLAAVAYRMQLYRARKDSASAQSDIVINKTQVQQWLREAMMESGANDSRQESEALLKYFAQRSGLLLPRGEGRFAFMHLSLQEYFAACFLEPKLTASRFAPAKQRKEPSNAQLRGWANSEIWTETFILLFELLSEKSLAETETFLKHLVGKGLTTTGPRGYASLAQLLAELAANPFVLLSAETRKRVRQQCWRWIFALQSNQERFMSRHSVGSKVLRTLLRDTDGDLGKSWKAAGIGVDELRYLKKLNLSQCPNLSDVSVLSSLENLTELNLRGCTAVTDMQILAALPRLEVLIADSGPSFNNLEPLRDATNLKTLILDYTGDLNGLRAVPSLENLHLHPRSNEEHAQSMDLSPLSQLPKLQFICVGAMRSPVKVVVKSPAITAPVMKKVVGSNGEYLTRFLRSSSSRFPKSSEARVIIV